MMRKLLILLIVLAVRVAARGQGQGYVQVTGTKSCYGNGSVNAAFVNLSGGNQLPLLNGSVFPTTATTNFDSAGNLSFFVADNSQVIPSPSQWTFTACAKSAGAPPCGTFQASITGPGPVDVSSQMAPFTCPPTSGGGTGVPGGSNLQFQYNNDGAFGGSPLFTYNTATGPIEQLPVVDVRNPGSAAAGSCANPADPLGVLDSTCAITAAIFYSATNPQAVGYPKIYLPAGTYKTSEEIRIPCYMHLVGDGPQATIIEVTNNTANGITVTNVMPTNAPPVSPNLWTCNGSLENFTVHAPAGHLYTATLIELQNAVGLTLFRVRGSNGGGRGLQTLGSTERLAVIDTEWDTIRWPIIANGNEQRYLDTNIASPGEDSSGYCMSPNNCVNGVFPSSTFTVAQNLLSLTANGSSLTAVVQGGSDAGSTNGVSPIVAGHWFQLSNVTNIAALNGFFQATSITNNSAAGQYTVHAATTASGTAAAGAVFKPAILPETRGAFFFAGAADVIIGGSIKATWFAPCFQANAVFGGMIEGFYCEGYPVNGQPHLNASIVEGGYPPFTTLTSAINASNVASVASTQWFSNYVTNPADIPSIGFGGQIHILPADFLVNSTAASTAVPGILRGEYEVCDGIFAGDGAVHLARRNDSGSTIPGPVTWPAGSVVSELGSTPYGTLTMKSSHLEGVTPPGPNWAGYCVDGTPLTCAEAILGPVPNGYTTFTMGQLKGGGGQANVTFEGDEWWGTSVPPQELYGEEYIKGFGDANVSILSGGDPPRWAETTEVANSQFQANGYPVMMAVQYPLDSSFAWLNVSYPSARMNATVNSNFYESMLVGTSSDPNVGSNPGAEFTKGRQFYGSTCDVDMGSPASPHVLNRFCSKGYPENTSANAGWEWDQWNGTAWVDAFSVGPAAVGGTAGATLAQLAAPNKFTAVNSFPDLQSVGATIGGVVIGNLSNLTPFSNNFTGSGSSGTPPHWATTVGTAPSFATGQADPWGTTTATQWTTAPGINQYAMIASQSASPIYPAGAYNVCIWARGAVGGETFLLGMGTEYGQVTLTTSYGYYCEPVTITAASDTSIWLQTPNTTTPSQTFTVACMSTTVATNATGCIITGVNQAPTPTAMVAIGTQTFPSGALAAASTTAPK